jgi:lipoxygenase
MRTDKLSEKRSRSAVYVPRDEAFSEIKQMTFSAKTVYAVLHAVVPALETAIRDTDLGFPLFASIDSLYNEGISLPPLKDQGIIQTLVPRLVNSIASGGDVLRFVPPETMNSKQIDQFEFLLESMLQVKSLITLFSL